ncbi:GNAT family N-acetyltransferase [Oxalobacteraceae bacterium A2-2]
MNVVVREANDDDARLIADLTRAAWSNKVAVTSSGHRETAVQVRQHLRDGGGFVLEIDHEPVGSVRWCPLDGVHDIWEVKRMGVLPRWRGSNLSQHLLEAVVHHAQTCGVEEIRLAVRADQPKLIDFYAAYEFELAEELEYTDANPLEPAPLVMRRQLRS